jgi:hypothetical protein
MIITAIIVTGRPIGVKASDGKAPKAEPSKKRATLITTEAISARPPACQIRDMDGLVEFAAIDIVSSSVNEILYRLFGISIG